MQRNLDANAELVAREEPIMEVDLEFHLLMASASRNPALADCMRMISSRMRKGFWKLMKGESLRVRGRPSLYLGHHRAVFEAISEQNASKAKAAVTKHLRAVSEGLEE
jgi:DNA-binding FadR family transcriptional regulator